MNRAFAPLAALSDLSHSAERFFVHLAAGTLSHSELDAMTTKVWKDFSFNSGADGFMAWEAVVYGKIVRPGDRILVVGCGQGRDLLPFVENGHEVVGIDPSPEPVETLRDILTLRGLSAELIVGFIESAALTGAFDLVTFSFLSYSYIRESARRIATLKRLAAHLRPGGRVLINYMQVEGSRRARAIELTKWIARLCRSDWTPEDNDVISVTRSATGERLLNYEHWFSREEIEREVQTAGFRVLPLEGPAGIPLLLLGL